MCFIYFWIPCVLHSLYKATCMFILCFYFFDWSTVCLNIVLSNMGVALLKGVILGLLFASRMLLMLGQKSPTEFTVWIKFPWMIIVEVGTILFCRLCCSCMLLFGNVRCLLLIGLDSCHFSDIAFVKKVTPISLLSCFPSTIITHNVLIHLLLVWQQINLFHGSKYI